MTYDRVRIINPDGSISVVDKTFSQMCEMLKPLDEALLHEVFKKYNKVITVEDGCIEGGMGSAILEFMADNNYNAEVVRLGIPDAFIEHGEQPELWAECGYDANAIAQQVKKMGIKRNTHTIAS